MDIITGVLIVIGLTIIVALGRLFYKLTIAISKLKIRNAALDTNNIALDEIAKEIDERYRELDAKYIDCADKLNKTVHQKKSSEVRLGKIGENLAPFTEGWPWDPNNFRFLGSPIDGIQFTQDMIYLVEIKTGKARLSKYQTKCKELVTSGKITFVTYRIGEEGTEITEFPIEKDLIK